MSSLFFTNSQEHALIAFVIKEAQAESKITYFGRTALQKVLYFLKALGVPMRYQYEIHHYGPFCEQIGADVDLLMADGIVVDRSSSGKYFDYGVSPEGPIGELLSSHAEFVGRYSDLVKTVIKVFGPLDPKNLELYATLHYAYRYENAGRKNPDKQSVLARFREYKGAKFTQQQLDASYDALLNAGLFKS